MKVITIELNKENICLFLWKIIKTILYVFVLFGCVVGIVACVLVLSFAISQLSLDISNWLSSDAESSTLIDLSVNSILVSVTIVYVLATYGILAKTEESIKQNKRSMDENSKNQERKLIEDKFEKFYFPLDNLLKSEFEIDSNPIVTTNGTKSGPSIKCKRTFSYVEDRNASGLTGIINCQYLAKQETRALLKNLISKIYESASSTDQELIQIYSDLKLSVAEDIRELNEKFESI